MPESLIGRGTVGVIARSEGMTARCTSPDDLDEVPIEWIARAGVEGGDAVAMVHGFLASNAVWRVDAFREALAGSDAIAMPLPGHAPWTIDAAETGRLLAVTERLVLAYCRALERAFGNRPVRLVGHSSGGMVVLEIARRRPDLVSDVFVFGAVGSGQADDSAPLFRQLLKMPAIGPLICHGALLWWLSGPRNFRAGLRSACGAEVDWPFDLDALRRDLNSSDWGALRAVGHWVAAREMFSYCDEIDAPTCMLLGTADPVSSPTHQLRLLRALPRAYAVVLQAGHLPIAEKPRAFARTVSAWLDRVPQRPPGLAAQSAPGTAMEAAE
jgi:pimeloyl-ACP methyl ester carboxylesterase